MRDGVNSKWFRFKKAIYNILNSIAPSLVTPIYTYVSFTSESYSKAWKAHEKQERMVHWVVGLLGLAALAGVVVGIVFLVLPS